jgi:hypothetical protein
VLTISRLSRWSINYYNDTASQAQAAAMDRRAAGGGLGEYYSESDTRVPTWLVAGDVAALGELTGLNAGALRGGFVDTTVAARWLDDGVAPNGAGGRAFTAGSVHGFDLTFAAPKSVSLLRALTDDIGEKVMATAHQKGIDAAMAYLHEHAGYIIISRHNDATLTVEPAQQHRRGNRIDQVRNGNRWRVVDVGATQRRIAAERLTDQARVTFESDYLREHITLGYATTLHAAQGITVGSSRTRGACFTVLSDKASRAMAYVGMTRGKDENHAFIYQLITGEADHEHARVASGAEIHTIRRGNKYAAAHYFRIILANDDRPRTMHTEAERTDRELLPPQVAALLDRNDERRAARRAAWQQHSAEERSREATYHRITATTEQAAQRRRHRSRDQGYGLEL